MKKNTKYAICIFALALVVRIFFLIQMGDCPSFHFPIVDSLTYHEMAHDWVTMGNLSPDFFWHGCFYPFFLSFLYGISGSSLVFVKILQMILGAITAVLVFKLGLKVFNLSTAWIGGGITALYMPLVFFESQLLAAGLAAFWGILLVFLFIQTSENPTPRRWVLTGLVAACSILTRPVFLPFVLVGGGWLIFLLRHKKPLKGVAFLMVGFLVAALPAAWANHQVMGKFTLLPYSGGINFFVGNNPDYQRTISARPGLGWEQILELPVSQGITEPYEKQSYYYGLVRTYLFKYPTYFLQGLIYKSLQFLSSREMPRNVDIYLYRKWSTLLKWGTWKLGSFGFPFFLLLPFAILGIIMGWQKVPSFWKLFLLLYPAAVILVFVTSRYRIPVIPLLIPLGAYGVYSLNQILRNRQWLMAGVSGLVLFFMVGMGNLPGPFFSEQIDFLPEYYFNVAESQKKEHLPQAIPHYRKAIALRPQYIEANYMLGLGLAKLNQFQDAITQFQRVLALNELDPHVQGDTHHILGILYLQLDQAEVALTHLQESLKIIPNHPRTLATLAACYKELNLPEKAQEVLERIKR